MKERISRRDFLGRSLKTGLALAMPTILTRKARADILYNTGNLETKNWVNDYDHFDCSVVCRVVHMSGPTEEYESKFDCSYKGPLTWITPVITKIVSIIPEYELRVDARPLKSFTPVNLELSLHSEQDTPVTVSNLENELHFSLPNAGPPSFWDFSPKPITLWRRIPIIGEPYPDKYNLQFLADIREACAKQGGTGRVPLPNLDGEYGSQVTYDFLQLRFDVYPGDLNLDDVVDVKDLTYVGKDWKKTGAPLEFIGDITGELGLPDGKVDTRDLELLTRPWLKDIKDIMP